MDAKREVDHEYFDLYRAPSGYYFIKRQIRGRHIEQSLKTKSRGKAITMRSLFLVEHLNASPTPPMKNQSRSFLREGFVYFLQDSATKRIKIGTSKFPMQRIAALQRVSPSELIVLHVLPGGRDAETELHRRLWASRTHGEWFEPTEQVLMAIKERTMP